VAAGGTIPRRAPPVRGRNDMSTVSRLAAFVNAVACRALETSLAGKLSLHLFDALGALTAGMCVPDARAIAAMPQEDDGAGSGPGAAVSRPSCAAAAIRCTEIDDIHLSACVTPSAAIVPVVLHLASRLDDITGPRLLAAYLCGLETMIRFAVATGGPRLMQRGIWPSRLCAPVGAAAAAAALLSLDGEKTAHALAIAAAMAGGLSPRGGVPSSRWLIFGRAVGDGLLAARAAEGGMKGDPSLLDGSWSKATGIELDPAALVPQEDGTLLASELGLKPWCAARQTMAAIAGFEKLCSAHGLDPAALKRILVEVPPAYAAMIDHKSLPAARPGTLANLRYLLGLAAFAPEGLTDVRREDLRIDGRFEALARIIRIEPTDDFQAPYPARWPARITLETAAGARHAAEITDVPGDARHPLGWDTVEGKINAAAGLPAGALDPLADACRALPAARSPGKLLAALSSVLATVDERLGPPIRC
jgi:2-methylcitrate dehydratase PrpD